VQVDPRAVPQLLGLPASTPLDVEPLGPGEYAPLHVTLRPPGETARDVLVSPLGDEASETHGEALEALAKAGYEQAPRPVAAGFGALVEEWVEGLNMLAVTPSMPDLERAVDAIAALHALPLRAGQRWERPNEDLLPGADVPLHRLGFAADERDTARPHIAAAREALAGGPFGFTHGRLSAGSVLLAARGPVLIGLHDAVAGHQLCDLAPVLVTAGLDARQRSALALRYAGARALDPGSMPGLLDLAGILWAIEDLLLLPRRIIEASGDDLQSSRIALEAARTDAFLRDSHSAHPEAAAIRAALWPS
jgi:hypothetical protein